MLKQSGSMSCIVKSTEQGVYKVPVHEYTGKRRVKILTGWEGNNIDGLIILTNATPKAIKQWIESDQGVDYNNLKSDGWYVRCLYDPKVNAFGDCTAIGCDEAYTKQGIRVDN